MYVEALAELIYYGIIIALVIGAFFLLAMLAGALIADIGMLLAEVGAILLVPPFLLLAWALFPAPIAVVLLTAAAVLALRWLHQRSQP
jgi:hypothetical protein